MRSEMDKLLKQMVEAKASDLILEANAPMAIRVSGNMSFGDHAYSAQEVSGLLLPLLIDFNKKRLEEEKQVDFAYSLPSGERFRVNIHHQRGSLAAAFRLIARDVPGFEDLNLPPMIKELAGLQNGLIIVTGPTGSGKTTTQACMIDMINQTRAAHVITIEDPIEYVFKNNKSLIEQREVGEDVNSFADGLRAALRQNPDVILIGEMRDLETTSTAITAAETGHLVISTLHTANAVNAIDRIIDIFPGHQQNQIRIQLSMTLQAIVAQQLIPSQDGKGQAVAVEVLKGIPAIRNLIRKSQNHEIPTMMEVNKKQGLQTMEESLVQLYKKKLISLEQALARVADPEAFKKRINETR